MTRFDFCKFKVPAPTHNSLGFFIMSASPIRIVIADDSPAYRQAISRIIQNNPHFKLVAEAGDGQSAVNAVEEHQPDVALMDISMPILNGLDATLKIKFNFPEVSVIILTIYDLKDVLELALKAGAYCCINKEAPSDEIVQAITGAGS